MNCKECAARLEQAAELVQGKFLGGFTLGDCPVFDEWAPIQRERLNFQIVDVLVRLTGYHDSMDNFEQAEAYATRLLELDPLQESAHRQLMHQTIRLSKKICKLAGRDASGIRRCAV